MPLTSCVSIRFIWRQFFRACSKHLLGYGQGTGARFHRSQRKQVSHIAFLALQGSLTPIWLKLPKGESSSPRLSTGECVLNLTSEETTQPRSVSETTDPRFCFPCSGQNLKHFSKGKYWILRQSKRNTYTHTQKNRSHTLKSGPRWDSWDTAFVSSWAGSQPSSWPLSQRRVLFCLYLFYKIFFPFWGKTLEARIIKTTHLCMS